MFPAVVVYGHLFNLLATCLSPSGTSVHNFCLHFLYIACLTNLWGMLPGFPVGFSLLSQFYFCNLLPYRLKRVMMPYLSGISFSFLFVCFSSCFQHLRETSSLHGNVESLPSCFPSPLHPLTQIFTRPEHVSTWKMQRFVPEPECCGIMLKIEFFFLLRSNGIRAE